MISNYKFIIYILICIFLLTVNFSFARTIYNDIDYVKFVKNYDGDTITFDIPGVLPIFGSKIPIRIYGIDTPEIKAKCEKEKRLAIEAKIYVYNLLSNAKEIKLKNTRRDKYFRILCDVYVDGNLVSKLLIDRKYAVPYFGKTKIKDWCK